jgi:hypothetical protein
MTRAEEYKYLADRVRERAKTTGDRTRASEWDQLADCYVMLAQLSERKEQTDREERSTRKVGWLEEPR